MNLEKLQEIRNFLSELSNELDEESARLQDIEFEWRDKHEAVSKIWEKVTMANNYLWEACRDWEVHTSGEKAK